MINFFYLEAEESGAQLFWVPPPSPNPFHGNFSENYLRPSSSASSSTPGTNASAIMAPGGAWLSSVNYHTMGWRLEAAVVIYNNCLPISRKPSWNDLVGTLHLSFTYFAPISPAVALELYPQSTKVIQWMLQ